MPQAKKQKQKEAKKRYFERVYNDAPLVSCACGCGGLIKSKDKYGRDKKYINGHNGRKYSDPKQYKREWNYNNRDKRKISKKKYTRKRKIKVINLKNSKCNRCGLEYDGTNAVIFQFHHINPENKSFLLSFNGLNRHKWSDILLELDKCEMLCANCHFIVHTKDKHSQSQQRVRQYKKWAIDLAGRECKKCGIKLDNWNLNIFQFHHLDSNVKESNISRMYEYDKDKVKKEIDKCYLLCANCHFLEHNEKF